MFISPPRFDLKKERTGALWFGLVFFCLLSVFFVWSAVLPFLPDRKRPPPEKPEAVKQFEQGLRAAGHEPFDPAEQQRKFREKQRADARRPFRMVVPLVAGLLFIYTPILPIVRELRARSDHLEEHAEWDQNYR